ncbi:unnamed protein product [Paramecium primaurelia]|uniref:Uncharacterized protein n=1 Tax=Paramecium primaurelia TaxID=5886 RepID=A0A8S1NJE3_PARPR|nr:unnamed protein product [Paramecium primaurelia]
MEYFLTRFTVYGNPFYNLNAGRDHTDWENQSRLRKALSRFQQSEEGQALPRRFTDQQVKGIRWGLPVVGLFLGRFIGDIYCAQSSIYMKGIFAVVGLTVFNKIGMDVMNDNEISYWTSNFPKLPSDIQKALSYGDARYTGRWID